MGLQRRVFGARIYFMKEFELPPTDNFTEQAGLKDASLLAEPALFGTQPTGYNDTTIGGPQKWRPGAAFELADHSITATPQLLGGLASGTEDWQGSGTWYNEKAVLPQPGGELY